MFNIPDQMQTAYQQRNHTRVLGSENTEVAYSSRRDLALEALDAFGVGSSQIPD